MKHGPAERREMEKRLEITENAERIEIPEIVYQGDDKKLKERVHKFKAGSFRIGVFTVMGLFMGFFSHTYPRDSFLPMKIIFATPYKLSEAIYVSVLGTDADIRNRGAIYLAYTEFFPHSGLATLLAETVTTILIGGAIYGMLAYFTGDKRVFTLQRFLKFAGCWCGIILLVIGLAYGINTKAVADNERLRGKPDFFLTQGELPNGSFGGGRRISDQYGSALRDLLYSELEPLQVKRNVENEVFMVLDYSFGRAGVYRVNYQDYYLVTEQERTYHISEEFAEMVGTYYETGQFPEDMEKIYSTGTGEGVEVE